MIKCPEYPMLLFSCLLTVVAELKNDNTSLINNTYKNDTLEARAIVDFK